MTFRESLVMWELEGFHVEAVWRLAGMRPRKVKRGVGRDAEYALFRGVVPRNAPTFSGAFCVFLSRMQYQTKVPKPISRRC